MLHHCRKYFDQITVVDAATRVECDHITPDAASDQARNPNSSEVQVEPSARYALPSGKFRSSQRDDALERMRLAGSDHPSLG